MRSVVAAVLMGSGVVVAVSCALGTLFLRYPADRLHLLTPVSLLSPLLFAVAVAVEEGIGARFVKAVLVWLILALLNPVLTQATAQAGRGAGGGSEETA